jgi:heme exporter protein D
MHPYELREFLAKVGQEGLERMNRELHTEDRTLDQWAHAIADRTNERKFCNDWHLPTEAEKVGMISAAKAKYHKLSFWVAMVVSVMTLIILIVVTIEVRDLAKSVTPGEARQPGSRAGPRGPRSR